MLQKKGMKPQQTRPAPPRDGSNQRPDLEKVRHQLPDETWSHATLPEPASPGPGPVAGDDTGCRTCWDETTLSTSPLTENSNPVLFLSQTFMFHRNNVGKVTDDLFLVTLESVQLLEPLSWVVPVSGDCRNSSRRGRSQPAAGLFACRGLIWETADMDPQAPLDEDFHLEVNLPKCFRTWRVSKVSFALVCANITSNQVSINYCSN